MNKIIRGIFLGIMFGGITSSIFLFIICFILIIPDGSFLYVFENNKTLVWFELILCIITFITWIGYVREKVSW